MNLYFSFFSWNQKTYYQFWNVFALFSQFTCSRSSTLEFEITQRQTFKFCARISTGEGRGGLKDHMPLQSSLPLWSRGIFCLSVPPGTVSRTFHHCMLWTRLATAISALIPLLECNIFFLFNSLKMVNYTDWFSIFKPVLYSCSKLHLVIMNCHTWFF